MPSSIRVSVPSAVSTNSRYAAADPKGAYPPPEGQRCQTCVR